MRERERERERIRFRDIERERVRGEGERESTTEIQNKTYACLEIHETYILHLFPGILARQ